MKFPEEDPARRAFEKALRLLALRDHSCKEMRSKLADRGYLEPVIGRTIERLLELKYLDDGAFAVRWARHLVCNKLYGNRRIEAGLFEKGIPRDMAAVAITEARLELSEANALDALIGKKIKGPLRDLGPTERRRLAQALFRKGYPQALIYEKLGKTTEDFIDDGL